MTYITPLTKRTARLGFRIMAMALIGAGILLLQSGSVHAQWATNGTNINNTNTGNVGIGTTTPAYRLDIVTPSQWAARFRKTDATNGGIIIESAAGFNPNLAMSVNGTIKWYLNSNTSSADSLQFWESTGVNARFTLTQAGNLGLGTTNPQAPFSVASNTGGVGNTMALFDSAADLGTTFPNLVFQRSRGTQAGRTAVMLGDRLGGFAFRGYGATNFNVNNDNAVIRAFAAENFTDTAMGTYITFETTPTGTAARTEKLRISANGDIGIGTATPGYKLDINGNLNVQGGTTFFRQSSGLAGNQGAYVSIGATVNNEASLALGVYRAGVYTNRFMVNNFGQVILQPNGDMNVGVGTNTPNFRLDVQGGAVNASGGLCMAGDCKTAWSQVGGGGSQWTTSGANIHYNTGSVGIGTTAPSSSLLHLHSPSHAYLRIGAPLASQSSIAFNDDTHGQDIVLYRRDNTRDFAIWTATASNVLSVTQPGNVGIGNVAPGSKLDVTGTIRSGNADTNIGNHPSYGNIFSGFWRQGADYSVLTDGSSTFLNAPAAASNLYFRTANLDKMMLQGSTGNLGIGTTSPSQKLDINGNLNIRGGATFFRQSSGLAGGEGASVSIGATINNEASFALNVYRGGAYTNRMTVNNFGQVLLQPVEGNVGIGTGTPAAKLDVVGDVNVSGTITGGNIQAKYQDVAEWVQSSQPLVAGTVVVLDQTRSNQVIASSQAYDTRVAGVISLQPGITLGENGAGKVLVATTGRVRIKVDASSGPIQIGDLLVTSGVPGLAMKSQPIEIGGVQIHRPGTLIGKALERLERGTGEILVLLSLQ